MKILSLVLINFFVFSSLFASSSSSCSPNDSSFTDCCCDEETMNPENLTDGCSTCACSPCCCSSCDFVAPCAPENCGYNCPDSLDIKCSWDIGLYGAFLYFQAKEEGLETAIVTEIDPEPKTVETQVVDMNFKYKPAFRVGFSANFCNDNWVLYAEYLWYHTTNANTSFSIDAELNSILQVNNYWGGFVNGSFDQLSSTKRCDCYDAEGSWKIDLDIVDLQLARKYYVGQCLTFMPHIGLRALWMDQKYKAEYFCLDFSLLNESILLNSTSSFSSWAIGARGGIDTNWNFCAGIRFFGNTNLSILYTDYDSIKSDSDALITTATDQFQAKGSFSTDACFLRPETDIALGVGWGDYFCCNSFYFDMAFAYEFHVFWDQNMLPNSGDYSTIPSALRGNLYLHGLSITARLDF